MAFPGLRRLRPGSPSSPVTSREPGRVRERGTPGRGGLGCRGSPAGLGWGSPGRGGGEGEPGRRSIPPPGARPPAHLGDRGSGSEGEERLGPPGRRPPRRGGALTPASTCGAGPFQVVTREPRLGKKSYGSWVFVRCIGRPLLRHFPLGYWGLGIPLGHPEPKGYSLVSSGKGATFG